MAELDLPGPRLPEWPPHFPVGCPGDDTEPVSGDVYRLVRNERDWQSWKGRGLRDGNDCVLSSLSCRRTLKDAQDFRRSMVRYRNASIVHGVLTPEHGRIKQTGDPPHFSLWLRMVHLLAHATLFSTVPE